MWYWILLAAGALLSVVIIGIPAVIASVVLWAILLYKLWSVIQDGEARTTPGKGVGFMFIPFFNYYWIFIALPGWATQHNKFVQRHGLQVPPVGQLVEVDAPPGLLAVDPAEARVGAEVLAAADEAERDRGRRVAAERMRA